MSHSTHLQACRIGIRAPLACAPSSPAAAAAAVAAASAAAAAAAATYICANMYMCI